MRLTKAVHEDVLTLRIAGDLDALTAPFIAPELDAIIDDVVADVVLDLSELTRVDSSGVAVVVSLYRRVRNRGRGFRLIGIRAQPAQIFEILGLDRVFHLPPSRLRAH